MEMEKSAICAVKAAHIRAEDLPQIPARSAGASAPSNPAFILLRPERFRSKRKWFALPFITVPTLFVW